MSAIEVKSYVHFEQLLLDDGKIKHDKKYILIDFYTTWCGPCKTFNPEYIKLAEQYDKVLFLKVNIDKLYDLASEYIIRSIPAFLFYKTGEFKHIYRVDGVNKDKLISYLNDMNHNEN